MGMDIRLIFRSDDEFSTRSSTLKRHSALDLRRKVVEDDPVSWQRDYDVEKCDARITQSVLRRSHAGSD